MKIRQSRQFLINCWDKKIYAMIDADFIYTTGKSVISGHRNFEPSFGWNDRVYRSYISISKINLMLALQNIPDRLATTSTATGKQYFHKNKPKRTNRSQKIYFYFISPSLMKKESRISVIIHNTQQIKL